MLNHTKGSSLVRYLTLALLTILSTACSLSPTRKSGSTLSSELSVVDPQEVLAGLAWIEENLDRPNTGLFLTNSSNELGFEGTYLQIQHRNIPPESSYYAYNDYLSQRKWKDIFLHLGQQQKRTLVLGAKGKSNLAPRDIKDVAALLPPLANTNVYFSDAELIEALNGIPAQPSGVSYDALKERFAYADRNLEWNVLIIANRIGSNFYSFREIFAKLTPSTRAKFTQNLQSSQSWTKTQPFDLIQGMMATLANREINLRSIFIDHGINRTILTKQMQRGLYNLFNMKPVDDVRASVIPDVQTLRGSKPKPGNYLLVCNNDEVTLGYVSQLKSLTFNIGLTGFTKFDTDKLVGISEAKLPCGFQDYRLTWKNQTEGKTLPTPDRLNLLEQTGKRPIEALVTFALTDETDLKSIGKLKQFMKYRGYQLTQETDNIGTKEHFESEFIKNDIYIPVSHSMDVNNFDIGTSRSLKLVFQKKVGSKTVRLTALFPRKALEPDFVRLNVSDLSSLLRKRRIYRKQSAFILNASCNADLTIYTWSRAFHGAVKGEDFSQIKDTPHVLASTNSFPTSSWVAILSNFSYPLNAIDLLAEGKSPDQVFNMLESKPDNGLMFNLLAKVYGTVGDDVKTQPFEPVYNMQTPEALKMPEVKFDISPY